MSSELVVHQGSCHCETVKWEALGPSDVSVFDCNCTFCIKKPIRPFLIPQNQFKLLQGEDALTTYTYLTHKAKHIFCKKCGVQSFYRPKLAPECYGVMVNCVDSDTIKSVTMKPFDGQNWDAAVAKEKGTS